MYKKKIYTIEKDSTYFKKFCVCSCHAFFYVYFSIRSTIQILLCMLITHRAINPLFEVDLCVHMQIFLLSILKLNFHRISHMYTADFRICDKRKSFRKFVRGLESWVTLSTSVSGRCTVIISISNLIISV
jgi:hypothetical protein